uniref:Uncharacterized protein n=1 Tax=Cannabis sativa TaxID=3483 RepID=A0A803P9V4_CANSA
MSHPDSKIYPPTFVASEYTKRLSSPYIPKNFKPQFKSEMNDSRTEDCPINPNQEETANRYRRFLQEISESPPQVDKRSRKKIVQADEVADSTKEPKRPKTKAYMRKSSSQPINDVDKFLKVGNEVSVVGNEVSAARE